MWVLWSHIWSLVSNEVVISIYGMWIPVFSETTTRYSRKTEVKTGKLLWKERKLRETQPSLQSPKCLGTQTSVEKNIFSFGKLYSSRRTSAFANPLVRDNRVLVSDGQTSRSFSPWTDWFILKFWKFKASQWLYMDIAQCHLFKICWGHFTFYIQCTFLYRDLW